MKGVFSSPTAYTTTAVTIPFLVPCFTGTNAITAQTFSATTPYQITFSAPVTTVLSFPMHTDTAGTAAANIMKCGAKTYTTNQTWATVLPPADPST